MRIVLLSTYELGHQPFGLASAAAWLQRAGHDVRPMDVAIAPLLAEAVREAGLVAFYVPMHTATRLTTVLAPRIRDLNPDAHLCAFGLYAPVSEPALRESGIRSIIGGEFEPALVALADRLSAGNAEPVHDISLGRLQFLPPDRSELPPLTRYSRVNIAGKAVVAGYTEASRGCKHLCRHCPVVPVYEGAFRVIQPEIVLGDIRTQVEAGARHITFGDPDFLNGPTHARYIVEELHREFPDVTYDVTIKIEHLLKHSDLLPVMRATGCLFVTSAVESLDDRVLAILEKGHTHTDFLRAAELMRSAQLVINPTFIAFTPWTTRDTFKDLLREIATLELVDNVSPIQLALRLLIPLGSRLLEIDEIRGIAEPFDPRSLAYPWRHPDAWMDQLSKSVLHAVWSGQRQGRSRREIFAEVWERANERPIDNFDLVPRAAVPYLDEPWYC